MYVCILLISTWSIIACGKCTKTICKCKSIDQTITSELQKSLTFSPPCVPSEKEQASCDRIERDLPLCPSALVEVLNFPSRIWIDTDVRDTNSAKFLSYRRRVLKYWLPQTRKKSCRTK